MPADDAAPSFLATAASVVLPITAPARSDRQAFRLLFTTQDHADAICAGFERAEDVLGEDGGFEVAFDGRGSQPTVQLELVDGQVVGHHAIEQLHKALGVAFAMSARMTGR